MKLDKQTIMLFGGGLVLGYLICKFTTKSDAPVSFSSDGLMRAGSSSPQPTQMGSTPLFGGTGMLYPKSRRRN
jgi:hypothetical protein